MIISWPHIERDKTMFIECLKICTTFSDILLLQDPYNTTISYELASNKTVSKVDTMMQIIYFKNGNLTKGNIK